MKKVFTSSSTLWSCFIALAMMLVSQGAWAEYVKLTALDGTGGTGGEGYPSLVDANQNSKMGHSFDPANPDRANAYIVVKAEKAVVPEWYFLVTGGDTGSFPTRNWKKWNIYGGNFASDAEAKRDLENYAGWTLLDARDDETLLPAANTSPKDFQFNQVEDTTSYQYFWIEVLESVEGSDIWLQMAEWGLGTYGDFMTYLEVLANKETGTDEPVRYNIIEGDRNDGSGEGLDKLFDSDINTKWGNGFSSKPYGSTEANKGAYFIVKTSRAITPDYYKLVTGTDNASWNHRNWKSWQIYGISDADAAAEKGKPSRTSDKWVLLDKKDNISEEILPDKNCFTVIFNLSETNTTAYRYFRVEIDAIQNDGYMQMSEFSLGDEYTLALDRNALLETVDYDPETFAEKALLNEYAEVVSSIEGCTDPFELGSLNLSLDEIKAKVIVSESNYAELITVRNQVLNYIKDDNLTEAAMEYAKVWSNDTYPKAPDDDYPVGNFAYIKVNRQITGAEALAEVKRVSDYLINNTKFIDDPIYASYTALDGSGGFGGEDHSMLIDGDRNDTKWCTTTIPGFLIFKSDEPIKPTYYGLVTGGDTYSYPDRNWKTWKIYAANFDDDADATKESDKWVLIDEKKNVGTDVLKTTNKYESYINLSIGCTEPYQYFMIYVEAAGGGLMQMNEFTFYNLGNLFEYREQFVGEFADYDPDAEPAYIGYVNEYKEKFQTLQTATNAPDVMKAYNEMVEIQGIIASSVELYQKYDSLYSELSYLSFDSESLSAWYDGYTGENEGPGVKYIRGTHGYILENLSLDNTTMNAELSYLQGIINSVNEGLYILLGGHTVGEWGDGFYGNLIDGIAKNTFDEAGNEVYATKWGGQADQYGDTYIIFRTSDPVYPFFYTLTTGNDTGSYQDRNWGTWYIYAANFEGDGAATKDAEGWVLVDAKENVGKDRLHPVNAEESYFGFSTEGTTEYTYYKIVVTKAFSGNAIQMNEIHFGTEEEFEEIKAQYKETAEGFDISDALAQQSLLDEYENTIPEIEECTNMEDLFKINYALETLRETINASIASYARFQNAVEGNKTYLEENPLADSEAKTIFENYLNSEELNPELYPNGTAASILFEHEVGDSILAVELDFMETLKAAAVAAGYGPGMDVSSLIVNRTFAKASESLKDEEGQALGRKAEGWEGYIYRTNNDGESDVYAAEFCVGNRTFDINQTLTNLKNGYYKVTLNAGYRANGDNTMLSYNYAAMAYANGIYTYVPVIREGAADSLSAWHGAYPDTKIYSLDSTEVYGWGIYGCEGAAHAFAQGRYAITLVAKVTDGTLTLGVKNEGTLSNEWTAVGNFGLFYIGEDVAAAAEALGEAAEYNAARIATLTELYTSDVSDEENYPLAPGFGAAQSEALIANSGVATYEAEKTIGDIMQSIYETKKAYADLLQATTKVYVKWYEYAGNADAEDTIYEVRDYLQMGSYDDAAAVKQAKEQLYAQWPEFLQPKGKGNNVEFAQDEFAFDIVTTGINPSIEMTGLYEALDEDEVILSFDYTATEDLEGGYFYYETPNLVTGIKELIPTLPAASEWTTVYYDITNGVSSLGFGSAIDHAIFWNITSLASKEKSYELSARNFRIITKARMASEGGKPLNGLPGDLNGDGDVNIADAVTVLNAMASNPDDVTFDLNGDGKVDISDFVCVLNLMAE